MESLVVSVYKSRAIRHSKRLTNPTRQRGPSVARGIAKHRRIDPADCIERCSPSLAFWVVGSIRTLTSPS